jgi:hypothetical protein
MHVWGKRRQGESGERVGVDVGFVLKCILSTSTYESSSSRERGSRGSED